MKKVGLIIGFIFVCTALWYLFIKPYDYLVAFNSNTNTGTINQAIKTWGLTLENAKILNQQNLDRLEQQIEFNDSSFLYVWKIAPLTDSSSRVKVYIKDMNRNLKTKIALLFDDTDFEKRSRNTALAFHNKLDQHLKAFKVKIMGEDAFEATYCAYVPLKSSQLQKAKGMMQNYTLLSSFLYDTKATLNGRPFVEVIHWDTKNDSISFNFCYPIVKTDSLKDHKLIKYKQIEKFKALKATYNGNYITSDRAWYTLLNFAEKNNIKIVKKPIEVFFNNPNVGGNELNWQAEIFMPIQ